MSQICILYPKGPEQFEWLIWDGEAVEGPNLNTLAEIATKVKRLPLTFIMPARDVIFLKHDLPKMRSNKLLKALPFALEDYLSDEIDQYHFVLPKTKSEDTEHCAVINKKITQAWIDQFDALKLNLEAIVPEQCCLPLEAHCITLASIEHETILRTRPTEGYATETDNLDFFLSSLLESLRPEKLIQHAFTTQDISIEATCPIETHQHESQSYLAFLSSHVLDAPFNLRQGEFRAHKKANMIKRIWYLAAFFIIAAILLAFINNIVTYFVYSGENTQLNTQINAIYKKNFPGATSIVSPRFRMQEKLKQALSGASGNTFLDMSARLGDATKKMTTLKIENLKYNNGVMNIQISLSSFKDLKSLIEILSSQSLSVKQQGATIKNGHVEATLELKEGS